MRVGACQEALGELNSALQLQSVVILQLDNTIALRDLRDILEGLKPGKTDQQLFLLVSPQ